MLCICGGKVFFLFFPHSLTHSLSLSLYFPFANPNNYFPTTSISLNYLSSLNFTETNFEG